jgi:hypothetical protein
LKLIMVKCGFTMVITNTTWRSPAGNIVRPDTGKVKGAIRRKM